MISGEVVNLRAVERTDAGSLHRWLNDSEVMWGWGAPDQTVSLVEVQRRIEGWLAEEATLGRPVALIVETLEGAAAGLVLFSRYEPEAGSTELSLLIGDPTTWGQGLGADALSAAVGVCFEGWRLHRVWLRAQMSNDRAHRLYRRVGFVAEGTLRQAAFFDGRYEDVTVYGLLATEWPPLRADAAPSAVPV